MIFTSNDPNLDLVLDFSVFPDTFEGLDTETLNEYLYTLEEYEYDADYMVNNSVYPALRAVRAKLEIAFGYKLDTEGWLAPLKEEEEVTAAISVTEPVTEKEVVAITKSTSTVFYSNDPHLDLALDLSVFPSSFEGLEGNILQEYAYTLGEYFYKADYMENSSLYPPLKEIRAQLKSQFLKLGKTYEE